MTLRALKAWLAVCTLLNYIRYSANSAFSPLRVCAFCAIIAYFHFSCTTPCPLIIPASHVLHLVHSLFSPLMYYTLYTHSSLLSCTTPGTLIILSSHVLHLVHSFDTRMLTIQQYKRKTHGFRTFSCFGTRIWNLLPQDQHCSTLSSFKAKLKTFLFSQYFRPN